MRTTSSHPLSNRSPFLTYKITPTEWYKGEFTREFKQVPNLHSFKQVVSSNQPNKIIMKSECPRRLLLHRMQLLILPSSLLISFRHPVRRLGRGRCYTHLQWKWSARMPDRCWAVAQSRLEEQLGRHCLLALRRIGKECHQHPMRKRSWTLTLILPSAPCLRAQRRVGVGGSRRSPIWGHPVKTTEWPIKNTWFDPIKYCPLKRLF